MLIYQKIEDKLTELIPELVTNTQQNLGVLVEQWQEFLELVVQVPTELVKQHSETNVEKVECSLQ